MPPENLVELEADQRPYQQQVAQRFEQNLYELADEWNVDIDQYVEEEGPITVNIDHSEVGAYARDGEVKLSGPAYAITVNNITDGFLADKAVEDHPVPTHEVIKEAGNELRCIATEESTAPRIESIAVDNMFGYGALAEQGEEYVSFEREIFENNLKQILSYFNQESREELESNMDDYLGIIDEIEQSIADRPDYRSSLEEFRENYISKANEKPDFNRIHSVPMTLEEATMRSFVIPQGDSREELMMDLQDNREILQNVQQDEAYDEFADMIQGLNSLYDAGHLVSNNLATRISEDDIEAEFSQLIQLSNSEIEKELGNQLENEVDSLMEEYGLVVAEVR